MISLPDLERELGVAEGRIKEALERGQVKPDHTLPLGERTYFFFHRDRSEEVRLAIGAPKLEDHSIRDRFLQFVGEMDMTMSYKPVMLLALLDAVADDGQGEAQRSRARIPAILCGAANGRSDRRAPRRSPPVGGRTG